MISCLMPTFGRAPDKLWLVNEALQSFLLQSHLDCELIICNDTEGDLLVFDHPQVKVFNVEERFPTLSDKITFMIAQAQGDYLCRWDDDDISLPWRLSYSLEKLGDNLEWRPENYWYDEVRTGLFKENFGHANSHITAIWHRDVLSFIGGYPPKLSGFEDQAFNTALKRAGVNSGGERIPTSAVFYLYRWGVSESHLSSWRDCSPEGLQGHYEEIGKAHQKSLEQRKFKRATKLEPAWHRDHVARARRATLEKHDGGG